jgi:diguanylate cyclase
MFGGNNEKQGESWKRKYYDSLEELESREKEWTRLEAMLRNAMARLSVAMEGTDDNLDDQLEVLRHAIRRGADGNKLASIIRGITEILEKLEKQRKSVHKVSPVELMENILDSLDLPKALSRKRKGLRKSLSKYDEESDFSPLIEEFRQIISEAFTIAGKEGSKEKKDGGGLLGRVLNKGEKEKPPVSASISQEHSDIETAQAVLDALLNTLLYPDNVKDELDAVSNNIKQAQTSAELSRLAEQIASHLNGQLQKEVDAGSVIVEETVAGITISDAIIQLLEKLELPSDSGPELESIRSELEHEVKDEDWPDILDRVASLFTALRKKAQTEKKEIEEFLSQITSRLEQLDEIFQGSELDRKESLENGRSLSDAMRDHVRGIQTSVAEASDLEHLKDMLKERVDAISSHVEQFRETEEARNKTAEQRVEELNERLRFMEKESDKLRSRIKEEKKLAMIDALTGIHNRMAYEERSEQEFARWKRYQAPLSLIVVDIDFFKKINDNFGHVAGDKVLKTIAQLMDESVRETDFLARYGGEEFVVIMPDTTAKDALNVAEKLRVAVENCGFHYRGESVPITISCGISEFNNKADTTGKVFERADKALYQAKESGRNRCEIS